MRAPWLRFNIRTLMLVVFHAAVVIQTYRLVGWEFVCAEAVGLVIGLAGLWVLAWTCRPAPPDNRVGGGRAEPK